MRFQLTAYTRLFKPTFLICTPPLFCNMIAYNLEDLFSITFNVPQITQHKPHRKEYKDEKLS
jgi:hypothetical protein